MSRLIYVERIHTKYMQKIPPPCFHGGVFRLTTAERGLTGSFCVDSLIEADRSVISHCLQVVTGGTDV